MIAHSPIVLACRAHALTLAVCTTGAVSLSATATGYARTTGSFLTDGFRVGMEVTPIGFAATTPEVITAVTALTMTTAAHTVQTAASRTLSVGLPSSRAWENLAFEPSAPIPHVEETYLPGQMTRIGIGQFSSLEATSLYLLKLHGPIHVGRDALSAYTDALLAHFPPSLPLTLSTGDVTRVRGDLAPYPSGLDRIDTQTVVTVTIPLRTRSANAR